MEEHLLETPARGSFDFPVLSVAAAARLSRDNVVEDARIVVGAAACRPLAATEAAKSLLGRPLESAGHQRSRRTRSSIAKPLDNTDFDMTGAKGSPRICDVCAARVAWR